MFGFPGHKLTLWVLGTEAFEVVFQTFETLDRSNNICNVILKYKLKYADVLFLSSLVVAMTVGDS